MHAGTYVSASVMYQCSAAMSQQQWQVLAEHNGGDLKTDFPLSLRFGMEAANVIPCNKIYTTNLLQNPKMYYARCELLIAA